MAENPSDLDYRVYGVVTDVEGRRLTGARVTVFQQRLRERRPLGVGETDQDGRFDLRYRSPDPTQARLLIVVRADIDSNAGTGVESPLVTAESELEVDLAMQAADPAEFSVLTGAIVPLLDGIHLTDVVETPEHRDVTFLAQDTGRGREEITRVALAARLEAAYDIPAAAFYAFLRLRVPSALPSPMLDATHDFELVDSLVQRIGTLVFALPTSTQADTLKQAVDRQLLPASYRDQVDKITAQMQARRVGDVLDQPYQLGKGTLRQLLDAAALPEDKQRTFAQALTTNTVSMRNFWRTLGDGQHGFTSEEASRVQRALELGAYTKNHLPLVTLLQERFDDGTYGSLPDLARLSVDAWTALVDQAGPPSNVDAAGDLSPAEVFARVIYTRVTRSYPTAALSARISSSRLVPEPDAAPLYRFFTNNPSLELAKTTITPYLEERGEAAFEGIDPALRPVVLAHARTFQRMLRVTADVDSVQTLLASGFGSAGQIATMGRQQFFRAATEAGVSKRDANRIYIVSSQRYAETITLLTQLNRQLTGIWPKAIGSTDDLNQPMDDAIARDQSLATLFGSQDYCAVSDCTSVLSPSAYLCDLMLWLRNHPLSGVYSTALGALLDRRPDLGHLLLNCPNTDVALPYIDLVNELLENAVSPSGGPSWPQTTLSAEQLRAAPEYVNDAAYVILAGASYPQTLPYDTALDQLRTTLEQSGIELWSLRNALLPLQGATMQQRESVAAERFQLSAHATELITTPNDVASAVAWNIGPTTDLAGVPDFMQAASITYEQLLQLLDVVWIRGGGPALTLQGVNDLCDLTVERLAPAPLAADVLDRAYRFLRMWRRSVWTMWELDLLLLAPAVGQGTLDENALVAFATFLDLQVLSGLPVDGQLAFFQDLDRQDHRAPDGTTSTSLFARTYLDPGTPVDADLAALLSGGAVADPVLAHHLTAIQGALQVSADDAITLFELTDGSLTVANLSLIFRVTQLAASARLSITDLLWLVPRTAAGTLAGVFADPDATLGFLREVADVRTSGFTVDALRYVLTRDVAATGVTTDQLVTTLTATRVAIQQTHDEIFTSADPPMTVLGRELAQLPATADPATLAAALSTVDDTYAGSLADRNTLIAATFGTFMDPATAEALLAPLPGGLTPAQEQAAIDQRAHGVLAPLATSVTRTRVVAAVAAALELQPDVTALLMTTLVLPGTSSTLQSALTNPSLVDRPGGDYLPITSANFPDQFVAVRLIDKVGTVVRRLHFVASDLGWLLANAATYSGLDLSALPVVPAQPDLLVSPLLTTSLLVKLDRTFGTAPAVPVPDLYSLVAAVQAGTVANAAAAHDALASLTGWPAADITAFATAIGLAFPADYLNPVSYDRIRTLAAFATATGGNAGQVVGWGVAAPDSTVAASALGVLRSRYTEAQWLAAAPAIMDPLRERRSAALQARLLAQRDGAGNLVYGDTNGLFDHFLIDVEMSSCEVTTRVVQAYAAVQLFVERCLMGLEEPGVVVDLTQDDTWNQWIWMKRYRIWEANREVFLYPENWLVESDRPSRTEIYQKLEQEIHQSDSTNDYLESVALNYVDRLDELAHVIVTGTCRDPETGTIHVVGRTAADPPRFLVRSFRDGAWTSWQQIGFDIKASQVVPHVFRRRLTLFWADIKVANEPHQSLSAPQQSPDPPSQDVAKYVSIGLHFSVFRNGAWTPPQQAKGRLFDIPLLSSEAVSDSRSVEALYTLKVIAPPPVPGYGASLFVDVFRLGTYEVLDILTLRGDFAWVWPDGPNIAGQVGRAVFDGRFGDLEQRDFEVSVNGRPYGMLEHAQTTYGPEAGPLLPLPSGQADPDLVGEPGLFPQAGALATLPTTSGATQALTFTSISSLEQAVGPLLLSARVPFRVVSPDSDLAFDPGGYFFYQDGRRCYYVESVRYYQSGSAWLPVAPSDPASAPFEVRYLFHRFYHPYTRLFWHQLGGGGFPALYAPALQQVPDTLDPSHADVFSFSSTYQPVTPRVAWGEDNEIVDFARAAAYGIYNWELFFHTPLYLAERLSQNQRFEDALAWFHYIFDPTRPGPDPAPQRFWITKPLHDLTATAILQQRINNLLTLVNQGDANAVAEVGAWRRDPFNPFLIADQRPVAYMKRVVMSYLDNLIAWGDNLFSTDSREALNEATMLYVVAAEILGPKPVAVTPPVHLDQSFDDLLPRLDAFANAMVDIENYVPSGSGGGGGGDGPPLPVAQTFYFKIPPNAKLLGYWDTVADRLFKLRHCQNIAGATRSLALFDAPIDPGLLVRAQAAGVDLSSVLNDAQSPPPAYRFSALHPIAVGYCAAVRSYGAALLSALERRDAETLALLLSTNRKQLVDDMLQILQQRIEEVDQEIQALLEARARHAAAFDDANSHGFMNDAERTSVVMKGTLLTVTLGVMISKLAASGAHFIPNFAAGISGFGGTPAAEVKEGGRDIGAAIAAAGDAGKAAALILDKGGDLAKTIGDYIERDDDNKEKAIEARHLVNKLTAQIEAARIRASIAQNDLANHRAHADRTQHEIDYLTTKFTSSDLYDWTVGQLSDTYFQAYRLAYATAKQAERCYRYELGISDSSFVQFGYWDSLKKGLLAGERLEHDLRRMQSSYLQQNARKYEISRYLSLTELDPQAYVTLLTTGACDFELPESLFDADYPGHFQRHLTRVSLTVDYAEPGRFDNVSATLTLVDNSVRVSTDLGAGYARTGPNDDRFVDRYGAVGQRIVLSQGQDDPGLFVTGLDDNLADPRYLPFEGCGAISSWHLSMPASSNEIDLGSVTDVVLHLHYTAADGGDAFSRAVSADVALNVPTSGLLVVGAATTPRWAALVSQPAAADQEITFELDAGVFPRWTRGRVIAVTALTVIAASPNAGNFVAAPLAPLPTAPVTLTPVGGSTPPHLTAGTVAVASQPPGRWTFKVRRAAAGDFRSLTADDISDVVVVATFSVS